MKKIVLSLLLVSTFGFAQDSEKENLKKTEEAASKSGEEKPDGWQKQEPFPL